MTCSPLLAIILTDVQAVGGVDVRGAPIPAGVGRMTVKVAAALSGVAVKTIQNDLSEFKDRFDCASYRPAPGKRWGKRLITARDLETLRGMYPDMSSWK